jgi:DNA-binding MarR family transcriptional regulator/predicted GNAT family N-acyltransferase
MYVFFTRVVKFQCPDLLYFNIYGIILENNYVSTYLNNMNYIKELGIKAFGSRIKNFNDILMQDVLKTYKELNIDFEPRWFTIFQLLLSRNTVSITEIAAELGQSHPAVVQVVNTLEKKGLIVASSDPADQRKRLISLSTKGMETAAKLENTWNDIFEVTREILQEGDPDFLEHISLMERAISRKSLYQRIREKTKSRMVRAVVLIEFNEEHREAFQNLNISWLNEFLEVSQYDQGVLSKPDLEILSTGGMIRMLAYDNEIIGCFAIRPQDAKACELLKFTVRKDFRGKGLGEYMLSHAIDLASESGYKTILLFTHKDLKVANKLYLKAGFTELDAYPGFTDKTGRPSILMKLNINI